MKFWVLVENTACREDLAAEHGLSLYLETGAQRILFDMGASDAFWNNAQKMGVNLEAVDAVILSHAHCDHSGGLARFLEGNHHAKVYVSEYAFGGYYNEENEYIGMDPSFREHPQVHFVADRQESAPGLTIISCNNRKLSYPLDCAGLQRMEEGQLVPEDFRHEQYLLIEENGKELLISGCSHKGILNIMDWFRPDVLIGGFHFMKKDPEGEEVASAAQILMTYETQYYTCHCTGQPQLAKLKQLMGDRLIGISTGFAGEISL